MLFKQSNYLIFPFKIGMKVEGKLDPLSDGYIRGKIIKIEQPNTDLSPFIWIMGFQNKGYLFIAGELKII